MDAYQQHLNWIYDQQRALLSQLEQWASIHSGSDHLDGLHTMLIALQQAFSPLGGRSREVALPKRQRLTRDGTIVENFLGKALSITKHPTASLKMFLGGHMDIALKQQQPLEPCHRIGNDRLCGRGTADMKGGLLILLTALTALEKSPFAGKIGWHVLITPDEEIGSPGSRTLYVEEAKKYPFGLLFEPALPNGSLVSTRKGSVNYTLVARGKASHAGRDFFIGRNALTAIAKAAVAAENLTNREKGITVNIGYIEGGSAANIVPDQAQCLINLRVKEKQDLAMTEEHLKDICKNASEHREVALTLHKDSERPPKLLDKHTNALLASLQSCASQLDFDLKWEATGGVCDGNILADAGLPNVDSLGAVGGSLHTQEEYVLNTSLVERSLLVARFFMQLANEEIVMQHARSSVS